MCGKTVLHSRDLSSRNPGVFRHSNVRKPGIFVWKPRFPLNPGFKNQKNRWYEPVPLEW